jgi:hypothetical protein
VQRLTTCHRVKQPLQLPGRRRWRPRPPAARQHAPGDQPSPYRPQRHRPRMPDGWFGADARPAAPPARPPRRPAGRATSRSRGAMPWRRCRLLPAVGAPIPSASCRRARSGSSRSRRSQPSLWVPLACGRWQGGRGGPAPLRPPRSERRRFAPLVGFVSLSPRLGAQRQPGVDYR